MLTARSPYGAVQSLRLRSAFCASAHLPAAQRRLMVMPFGSCQKLGRSFPYWFLVVQRLSSRLTWHDFAYVTIVQKVRSGSVTLPCLPKVTYSNGLGPYIPVTPDPSSQPRALPTRRDRVGRWCTLAEGVAPVVGHTVHRQRERQGMRGRHPRSALDLALGGC